MNKILLTLTVTLISLNSFALLCEKGDSTCDFVPAKGGAGTNVVGANDCPGCAAMEVVGGNLLLSDAKNIATPNSTKSPNALPAVDPVNIGQ
ncbi:MAG: hypothetical protein H7256_10385 [Bdellovibrio sp.]|nr:hypothetical protein [Bdellovibrio sp.]